MSLLALDEKLRDPGECIILLGSDRTEIVEFYPFLTEVSVDVARDRAAVAALKFESIRDELGRWNVQDENVFLPWEPVVIKAAFGTRSEEVFRGFIREIKVEHPENSAIAVVTIACQDTSLALDRNHVRMTWGADAPTNDAVILAEVLGKYDLRLQDGSGAGLSNLVLTQDSTDIKFLRDRAEANGFELLFEEDTVYFGPMRIGGKRQDVILVYAGRATNCIRLDVQVDSHQPDRVALDLAEEQGSQSREIIVEPDLDLLGATAATGQGSGLEEFVWRMSRQGGATEEEMQARAQRKANDLSLRVRAEGELDGSAYGHVLRVGHPVTVDGLGSWLGGAYYVDACRHVFDPKGYRQTIKLLRNAFGEESSPVSASRLAGVF